MLVLVFDIADIRFGGGEYVDLGVGVRDCIGFLGGECIVEGLKRVENYKNIKFWY